MTERRVKYIESIPVEEKYIRLELARQRHLLKLNKERLSNERLEDMIIVYQICIAQIKAVIKALKKQLPQSIVYDNESKHWGWNCPACRYRILNDLGFELDISRSNCPACGQLLRCGTLYKR